MKLPNLIMCGQVARSEPEQVRGMQSDNAVKSRRRKLGDLLFNLARVLNKEMGR